MTSTKNYETWCLSSLITMKTLDEKVRCKRRGDAAHMELRSLEPLLAAVEDLARNLSHLVAHRHRLRLVRRRNVVPRRVRVLLVAEGREALRDTDAGAVELSDNPLLLLRRRSR